MAGLESAIPAHLLTTRTAPSRLKDGFIPPYPSFTARLDPTVKHVVMAYLGVQYATAEMPASVRTALGALDKACSAPTGPRHVDRASYVDERYFTTVITIAYWDSTDGWERWRTSAGAFWLQPQELDAGYFAEVLSPSVTRFETLFSNDRVEGAANLADGLSGEVTEHGYWGGARDRLPIAQTDTLDPVGRPVVVDHGARQSVTPHENLCLIRSGQEWTETTGDERAMYLDDVEPVLRAGMDYLRDQGRDIGCFANRYMRVLGESGEVGDKSFGMSWWRSLEDLDRWAESHETHKAIFGAAMKYLSTMGPAAKLRLYHEVTVASAAEQHFEYVNCHPDTGMLRTAD